MTGAIRLTGASSTGARWNFIDWELISSQVNRLQMRIAKATRENHYGKVKVLQWLLTHSYAAKLLAVKRVTSSPGAKTPGVDGVTWKTEEKKLSGATLLKQRGYQAEPARRVYIPKKNGKQRPLGIPTLSDRAMQALYLLALEPIAETTADGNSYGFRPHRSCHDAIAQCFLSLCRKTSAAWVLEADIRGCFDNISHEWLMKHIPLDKRMLQQWLKAGHLEAGKYHSTTSGTPQGGVLSPALSNMVLDGLETKIALATGPRDKVNYIRYADDFVVTGVSREILETKVLPVVVTFLKERGLELSEEKTKITSIKEGFDFLGFTLRKREKKLIITPSKGSVTSFLKQLRETIKIHAAASTADLLWKLNSKLRGWSNYYRHVCAKATFTSVDYVLTSKLWRWAKRRHPNKGATWLQAKYFIRQKDRMRFGMLIRNSKGVTIPFYLYLTSKTPIERHIKVKAKATPYDPSYTDYFEQRKCRLNGSRGAG